MSAIKKVRKAVGPPMPDLPPDDESVQQPPRVWAAEMSYRRRLRLFLQRVDRKTLLKGLQQQEKSAEAFRRTYARRLYLLDLESMVKSLR